MTRSIVILLAMLLAGRASAAERDEFVPFPVDWKTAVDSPADLSFGQTGMYRPPTICVMRLAASVFWPFSSNLTPL